MTTAPALGNMANMVTDKLMEMAKKGHSTSNVESAIGATSGSKSLTETRRCPRDLLIYY